MNFLDQVVTEKQREIASARSSRPMASLLAVAKREPPRDFRAAVGTRGAVIAELKARTPTIESFTHSGSLLELARTYVEHGASAISIVTDPARFGTSLADIADVREAAPLPVIAKDFIIDPYQIVAARAAGADAVLLIVRLLDLDRLRTFLGTARDLGMAALVETHSEPEILAAIAAGAEIIGINNRDLDTMTVSLETTHRLAGLVPPGGIVVSESGIATRADVDALLASGATAFLVGGSLLSAADPGAALRALVTPA
ncbi:MAG TPA: indole-3-glycerol phosphate synthase TrpC, partial [Candidatus Krumholzibacteria bacterium]|nr:indole-3-glycerol phosphate synthase TrpC [Candidatus Krumholzibacteria bacterium]